MSLLVLLLAAVLLLTLGAAALLVIILISSRHKAIQISTKSENLPDQGTSNPWEEAGKRITCDNDEPV